ncbi:hypothetical protein [Bacillus sp. FJAT-42315]|uniref:hypothetical protein n=1 Tax=Bacillus sp. FJAT-42315 TaxID=2014077 RepID=UPI000BA947EE|nr:hypothetical protein [Bacillus sp. FJAT-42315]PAQ13381.1 hypothetical protein CD798_14885 [Bacillaceae bacterium SAOS 7]
MTREEVLRTLMEIEKTVGQIEREMQKRVAILHKAHCNRLWRKKELILERIEHLEEGADYLLAAPSSYKMVQSFKVMYEPL